MTTQQECLQARLHTIHERIRAACQRAKRSPDSVQLLAVSKTQPADQILAALAAGQTTFAENYVQEGCSKIAELRNALPADQFRAIEWHFIGPQQSNKTRAVAQDFTWVHSIDRLKIAERLAEQRDIHLPPLQVCLQVNVSGETSKSGLAPTEVEALAHAVARLPRLTLRGLMCIPEPTEDEALLRARFALLRQLRDNLNQQGLSMDTLSMGMSHDFEIAIEEGATMVRIGTAIFGERHT